MWLSVGHAFVGIGLIQLIIRINVRQVSLVQVVLYFTLKGSDRILAVKVRFITRKRQIASKGSLYLIFKAHI